MNTDDERVKEIFQELLDTPSDGREALLDRACGGEPAMRKEIEALLKDHEAAGDFLAQPTGGLRPREEGPGEGPGAVIGPYHLLEEIGEGGFGVVYVAEQREPVRRRVALKVIRPGMDTREVVARFEAERQALALMDHPSIARVFDGGATERGRPYFVMELVRGIPISSYCDQCHLPLRERLHLFLQVCRAVQHAHQKGVIHRDLKPSNVLVAIQDGEPVPKVIDFGVAKATGPRLTRETFHTRFAQMIGTPQYMSPEQAEMSPLDVDTRSDVYSLGVILYELLTGTTPLTGERLRQATFDELRRLIREEEPPTPSARLTTLNGHGARVAAARRIDLPGLVRSVRGDLDWIAMKALEKDRTRRYETASAFAADVERCLRHEPVEARPPTAWYRLQKLVRRRRGLVAAVAVVLVVLIGGVVGTTRGMIRALKAETEAETQRDRAEAQAAAARAVNDFLRRDLLGQADIGQQPRGEEGRDPDVKVKTLLDRAAASIEGRFVDQPLTEALIRATVGGTYYTLGRYAEAERHLERSMELHRAVLGPGHRDTLSVGSVLATVYAEQGRYGEAEALYRDVLEGQATGLGADDPETLGTKDKLATLCVDVGRYDEAEALYREALLAQVRTLGAGHPDTLCSKNNLATLFAARGRYGEAEALLTEALEAATAELGADHPGTLATRNNLARISRNLGRYAVAEALYVDLIPALVTALGPVHPKTLVAKGNLAQLHASQGRYDLAEPLLLEIVRARTASLGALHPDTLDGRGSLALLYKRRGDYHLAEPLYREVIEGLTGALGPDHAKTLATKNNLALLYHATRRHDAAEKLLREVLETRLALEPDHPDILGCKQNLALVCKDQGKHEEAERLFLEALAGRTATLGPDHRATLCTKHNLAEFYAAQRKYEQAEALYREVMDACAMGFGPADPDTLGTQNGLGALYLARGEHDRAAALLRDAAGHARRALGPAHPTAQAILRNLTGCLEAMGASAEFEPSLREVAEFWKESGGPGTPEQARYLALFGASLLKRERHAEAEGVLRECLGIREANEPDGWATFNARSLLGAALLGQRKHAEAEPLLLQGYEGMRAREAAIPSQVRATRLAEAVERLVRLYEDWGKKDEAARWRAGGR